MTKPPPEPLQILKLLRLVRRETGGAFDKAAVLQTIGSLSEGLSVMLLVPLLKALGTKPQPMGVPFTDLIVSPTLGMMLGAFVILIVARSFALERKEVFNANLTFGFAERMSGRMFEALAATRWSVISRWRTADMTYSVTGDGDRLLHTISQLLTLLQSMAMAVIFIIISSFLSWQMTLLAGAVGAGLLLLTMPAHGKTLVQGRKLVDARQAQFQITDEFFNGLRTAKAFGLEGRHVLAMREVLFSIRSSYVAFASIRARSATIYQVAIAIALSGFIWFAVELAKLPMERIVAMLFLCMRLAPRLLMIHSSLQELRANMSGVETMLGMLAAAEANAETATLSSSSTIGLRKAIELRHITYRYGDAPPPALDDICVNIPAGEITALIGPTGSGKSTLVDLMLGLSEPTAGEIAVDGVVLDDANRSAWQRSVAYVPQETFLFNATIAENLRMANPEADDAALWEALAMADAAQFVAALEGGIFHQIGNRGGQLSGGERQRIAIARALLRRPDLLILDEATSALDALSQARVISALVQLRGRMTILAVAHRPAMVGFADHLIVLEGGKVAIAGPRHTVMDGDSGHIKQVIDAEGKMDYTRACPVR